MLDVGKMVDAVLDAIDKPMRAMHERIKLVEARAPEKGEPGAAGIAGWPGKDGVDGKDGKDADVVAVPPELADQVASAVRMLHEAPPLAEPPAPAAKVVRIERDDSGNLVPIYE